MATFRKYEFAIYADYRTIHDVETESNYAVEIGHINSDNPKVFCVDILWNGEEPEHWKEYHVWPAPCGVHSFSGWEEQYTADFQKFATQSQK